MLASSSKPQAAKHFAGLQFNFCFIQVFDEPIAFSNQFIALLEKRWRYDSVALTRRTNCRVISDVQVTKGALHDVDS